MFESIFKKGIDNLRFALNLDDYVPEHIIDELGIEQKFSSRDDLSDEDKFNSDAGLVFSKTRSMLEPNSAYDGYKQEQILFNDIVGYDDLKELLTKCLVIQDSCQVRQHLLKLYSYWQYKKKFPTPVS